MLPRLSLPSPESLGITATRTVERDVPDWTEAHRRLDRLGASCFQLAKLPHGGCRITCLLPTAEADRTHRIEAQAASESEALRLVLAKADAWTTRRR
jgi:hypothetical protein